MPVNESSVPAPAAPTPRLRFWLINLRSRPDRLAAMTRRLRRAGVPFTVVEASTPADLPDSARPLLGLRTVEYEWGAEVTEPMLALRQTWYSLLARLQALPDDGTQWHVVLEDDARYVPGFRRRLERLLAEAGERDLVGAGYACPESWFPHESVATNVRRRLGANRYRARVAGDAVLEYLGRTPAWLPPGTLPPLGTQVVALRTRALADIADWLRPSAEAIDGAVRGACKAHPDRTGHPLVSLSHQTRGRSDISWPWMQDPSAPR